MTPADTIREALKRLTPGPWCYEYAGVDGGVLTSTDDDSVLLTAPRAENAQAILAIIDALPGLLEGYEAVTIGYEEAVELGESQANDWDRYWKAAGLDSTDLTVDGAIRLWQVREAERDDLRRTLAESEAEIDKQMKLAIQRGVEAENVKAERDALKRELDMLKAVRVITGLESGAAIVSELEAARQELLECRQGSASKSIKIKSYVAWISRLEAERDTLRAERDDLLTMRESDAYLIDALKGDVATAGQDRDTLQAEVERLTAECAEHVRDYHGEVKATEQACDGYVAERALRLAAEAEVERLRAALADRDGRTCGTCVRDEHCVAQGALKDMRYAGRTVTFTCGAWEGREVKRG